MSRFYQRLWMYMLIAAALGLSPVRGDELEVHSFEKHVLSKRFFSEGAHFADFNHDGKNDVVAGPYIYFGPDFQDRQEFFAAQPFDPQKYSNAFLMFVADFNTDQWADVLVVGWPGKEAFWYENPRNQGSGHWQRHLAFPVVDNESPWFTDITGDDRPEIVCHTGGRLGYAEPDWEKPTEPWTFHPVSEKGKWQRYTHGFGVGDVNGDGRRDILLREGWWEQPESASAGELWKHHPVDFGAGGAQMHVYDVNGDGYNDVVTSLKAHGYGLAWFKQTRDEDGNIRFQDRLITGSRPEDNAYGVKFSQIHALDIIDVDQDGLTDVVTGKRFWAHGPKGDVEPDAPAVLYWFRLVHHTDGRPLEFVPYQIDDDSGVGTQVIAGDISGDGKPDVVVGNKKGAFVFVQKVKKVDRETWLKHQPQRLAPGG